MKREAILSIFALLATALTAPGRAAQETQQASQASILFTRTNFYAIDSTNSTSLYRINSTGGSVVSLTPSTKGVDYRGGAWSPGGGGIVYEQAPQSTPNQSELFVANRQGGSAHHITSGLYRHQQASWGPGGIAFVTNMGDEQCLSVVGANGAGQHTIFCPPRTPQGRAAMVMSTPQWTASGTSVYVEVGNYGPGLNPQWFSRVYRVNVTTAAAVNITEQVFGDPNYGSDPQTLTISPDGKHGVYGDQATDQFPMMLVDFFNGMRTSLPSGTAPRYSKDGCEIAFVRQATTTHYGRVFVMKADGSNIHQALRNPDQAASYSIADWAGNDSYLLVNKVAADRFLQILNPATGAAATVTKGTAYKGAWLQP